MFEGVLPKGSKQTLAVLGKSGLLKEAYLAGGTALAFQIGHRISVDFDFFTGAKFNEQQLARRLAALPVNFELERLDWGTILGYMNKIKFGLFFYDYILLEKPQKFLGIKIAGIKDLAPMKLFAVSDRGTKRDFIDLYFIAAVEKLFSLEEIFDLYDKKFGVLHQNKAHILKSLTYFEEVDDMVMPRMLKEVEWRAVKKFFTGEAKRLARSMFAA